MKKEIKHIAFIMDGNGRWAKRQGKERFFGHLEGSKKIKEVCEWCKEYNIKYASFFAFSTENWKRPKEEIDFIFNLVKMYYEKEIGNFIKNRIRFIHIGDIDPIPDEISLILKKMEDETKDFNDFYLLLCFNYSGKAEIIKAVNKILNDSAIKNLSNIDEQIFRKYLYTDNIPDPDLLIRTSGEKRISNFYLFQLAYTELYFEEQLWPEYSKDHFVKAINDYYKRERRFGAI